MSRGSVLAQDRDRIDAPGAQGRHVETRIEAVQLLEGAALRVKDLKDRLGRSHPVGIVFVFADLGRPATRGGQVVATPQGRVRPSKVAGAPANKAAWSKATKPVKVPSFDGAAKTI